MVKWVLVNLYLLKVGTVHIRWWVPRVVFFTASESFEMFIFIYETKHIDTRIIVKLIYDIEFKRLSNWYLFYSLERLLLYYCRRSSWCSHQILPHKARVSSWICWQGSHGRGAPLVAEGCSDWAAHWRVARTPWLDKLRVDLVLEHPDKSRPPALLPVNMTKSFIILY